MLGHRPVTMDDVKGILRRRKWLLAMPAIFTCGALYAVSLLLPKSFTSQTLVLVERPTVPDSYVKPVVSEELNQRLASMQEEILSRTRLQPIIEHLGLYHGDLNRVPMEDLVARLRKSITVTAVAPMAETKTNNLPGFYISVTAGSGMLAQQICAQITSMFIDENLRLREQQAEDTTQFISKQLDDAKARLDEQDGKLAAFKQRYLGELPENEQTNLNLLMSLNTQLDAVNQTLARVQQDKSYTESLLAQQVAAWKSTLQGGKNPQTMEQQLTQLQNELISLQGRYTDDHPDVIKKKAEIIQLKQTMAAAAQDKDKTPDKLVGAALIEPPQIQQLRAQLHQLEQTIVERSKQQDAIQQQIRAYEGRVQLSPLVEQQYKELTRDYQTALDFYNDLLKKKDQSSMATDLERRQQGEQFRVLDPASLPEKPSFPNQQAFAVAGLGGGLVLGIALALFLELQDKSLRTEEDIEFFLKLPTLALVPRIDLLASRRGPLLSIRHGEKAKTLTSA